MTTTLTPEQRWALARLGLFLGRRRELETGATPRPGERWLVRALDHAIVSSYRLAHQTGLGEEAKALLRGYREASPTPEPRLAQRLAA